MLQVLFLECDEPLDDLSPNNPMLKQGRTISVGLDKNTKLGLVFHQYCKIVNSHKTPKKQSRALDMHVMDVAPSDLEFVHVVSTWCWIQVFGSGFGTEWWLDIADYITLYAPRPCFSVSDS